MVGYALPRSTRPRHALRADRRAGARRRAVGGNPEEPAALALPLRRTGHGAAGGGARAHLSRPLLERVLGRHRARFNEASREHYAKLYALPGAMHSGFAQFAAFDQDAIDNRAFLASGKLAMPVLAIGGEKSFGTTMADVMRHRSHRRHARASSPTPATGSWRKTPRRRLPWCAASSMREYELLCDRH